MPDHFYLSLWLRGFREGNMLARFRALLDAFPCSESRPMAQSIRVYPFDWTEHPVLEEDFREGADTAYVLSLAGEFLHGDYAYEATAWWDLWVFQKNGGPGAWKKVPCEATLLCLGPEFDGGRADRGHLQVDFGFDAPFRADQQLPDHAARASTFDYRERLKDNLHKLLDYVQRVEQQLPVERHLLWTESGENFAELIERSFRA